jgi:hypothetical protein
MQAVAAVIGNRADQSGLSPGQVITQKNQFEPYGTRAGRKKLDEYRPDDPKYKMGSEALDYIANGGRDPTGGADHFWSPKAQAKMRRSPPPWASKAPGQAIGDHLFHKLGYAAAQAPAAPEAPQPPAPPAPPAALPTAAPPTMENANPLLGSRYDDGTPEGNFNPQDRERPGYFTDVNRESKGDRNPVIEEAIKEIQSGNLSPAEEEKLRALVEALGSGWGGGLQGGFDNGGFGSSGVG